MGVYIKGMEMPKKGHTVTLTITGGGEAVVQYYDCKPQLTVPIVYKAVPVPPHGRLIDADEEIGVWDVCGTPGVFPHSKTTISKFLLGHCLGEIPPTIIPADKERGE